MKPEELEANCALLTGDDAVKANRAGATLGVLPGQSLPWLRERLLPVTAVDPQRPTRLSAELDNNNFTTRDKAAQELEELADLAQPALRQALADKPPLDVTRRVEAILEKIATRPMSGESLRVWRGIEVVEDIGSSEARQVLQALTKGAAGSRLTQAAHLSLDRLGQKSVGGPCLSDDHSTGCCSWCAAGWQSGNEFNGGLLSHPTAPATYRRCSIRAISRRRRTVAPLPG